MIQLLAVVRWRRKLVASRYLAKSLLTNIASFLVLTVAEGRLLARQPPNSHQRRSGCKEAVIGKLVQSSHKALHTPSRIWLCAQKLYKASKGWLLQEAQLGIRLSPIFLLNTLLNGLANTRALYGAEFGIDRRKNITQQACQFQISRARLSINDL